MKHEWVTKTEQVMKLELSQEEARWLGNVVLGYSQRDLSQKDKEMCSLFIHNLTLLPVGSPQK